MLLFVSPQKRKEKNVSIRFSLCILVPPSILEESHICALFSTSVLSKATSTKIPSLYIPNKRNDVQRYLAAEFSMIHQSGWWPLASHCGLITPICSAYYAGHPPLLFFESDYQPEHSFKRSILKIVVLSST